MNSSLTRSLVTAVTLLVAAPAAHAVTLVPGVVTPLPGTTVAAEPQLAGIVLEDELVDFSMTTSLGLVTGRIQSRVVRSDLDGTLDFYWRVFNDATSEDDVAFFRIGDFVAPEYEANWRIDGLGDEPPVSAFRFTIPQESFVNFRFARTGPTGGGEVGLAPGQSSNFMLLDTSVKDYAKTAVMDVASFGTVSASEIAATFAPIPEPSTLALLALGLTGVAIAGRRRGRGAARAGSAGLAGQTSRTWGRA